MNSIATLVSYTLLTDGIAGLASWQLPLSCVLWWAVSTAIREIAAEIAERTGNADLVDGAEGRVPASRIELATTTRAQRAAWAKIA